jgi:hypothetical protein
MVLLGLSSVLAGTAETSDECRNELQIFERDVRMARENNEPITWKLVGANYSRRVARYCTLEERQAVVAKLRLSVDEWKLLGVALE